MSKKKESWIYISLCIIITNALWYVGYSVREKNEESIMVILPLALASFMPAIIAIIMCKLKKDRLSSMLLSLNIKKTWKIYLLAIGTGLFVVYSADLLPLLFFPGNVSLVPENLTFIFFGKIILFTIISTIESIELLGEELGWMGYLFPRLEEGYGTFPSILIISIVRTLWHIVILMKIDGSWVGVCNLFLSNLLLQNVLVYVTKKSKSVFPAAIVHAVTNIMMALSFVTYSEEFYNNNLLKFNLVGLIPLVLVGAIFFTLLYRDKQAAQQREA